MNRFSFQIEPVAEFRNAKPQSPLKALRARLSGKTGFEEPAAMAPQPTASPARLGLAPARKPASIVAFRGKSARAAAAAPASKIPAIQAEAQNSGQASAKPVEYKGHVISVTQMEDGSWIATYARKGKAVAAKDAAGRKQETYLACFLAIACAELEIDELKIGKLAA